MAVCERVLTSGWYRLVLLFMLIWEHGAEEVDIFHSDKQTREGWVSEPRTGWVDIPMTVGTQASVPVLQACAERRTRTFLSSWMERGDANYLLMDVAFALEEEPSGEDSPLQVHLYNSDTSFTRFRDGWKVLDLRTSKPFPSNFKQSQIPDYLNRSVALSLGSVTHRGFHLAFSYSGTCALLTSIRLYYRRCPGIVSNLVSFGGTAAGSGPLQGSCVEGAVEVSPPFRQCGVDGVWGPLEGMCTCKPGHEEVENACQACRMGYYKASNQSGGCRLCPVNTRTRGEGSESCECVQGFSRLQTDPDHLGCTKPPSAPVNLTTHHLNDSVLTVTWDPPHDTGGRPEVKYRVTCEKAASSGRMWEACGDVFFLLDSAWLTNTSVSITGLNPQLDYRLSVQAWNDISTLQEALHLSTAAVTIQRWKVPPVVTSMTPGLNTSGHDPTHAPHRESRSLSLWLMVAALFVSLMLVSIFLIASYVHLQKHNKRRLDEQRLPGNPVFSHRRLQMMENAAQPEDPEGVFQLLGVLSDQLLDSLRDVLVQRHQLTLGKELGKGEFGSVYEGIFTPQKGTDIRVAVKTLRVGILSQQDLHEFLREAEIMKNFDHKNVVGLLGVTLQREEDSTLPVPLVILPFLKHGDLRHFLIATRYGDVPMFVPHQTLLRFMIDIAMGMDYLSSNGFLHRDLAARNCMLGDDLRVCVADFGLSKKIYSSNYYRQKIAIRVPIKWMSMESLSESIYTTKSDVWSFGVTMWEIVSRGRTPYPGVHSHELLDLLLSGHRLKPPEDCDQKLYEVMRSCWDREPSRRPDFRALAEALRGLLSELPVLEPSQEARYINQGLEVLTSSSSSSTQEVHINSGGQQENVSTANSACPYQHYQS
ncbi:tyrosine-protein kinase receptor TYRO3-like [Mugil cephalus]|uniref:tyrosine-protein kinase receptor TYRO3-like n=1 Tax=Mugil cephalus TaxID=48193 RepID=UPI001FB74C75|nr:tyrosine-protein kinase receptor TYRO3-like [Mugil cephalus]